MKKPIQGIHHITAIVGHPQENLDFYVDVLGLRLVKKTVNFDDPGTYHLYFGTREGAPGTIMTTFPWAGAAPGKTGTGMVGVTPFAVPEGALPFWKKRLEEKGVAVTKTERFGEKSLSFEDPHGLKLELTARKEGEASDWTYDTITSAEAIKGFAGAVLYTADPDATGRLLTDVMGLEKVGDDGHFVRYRSEAPLGSVIDIDTSVTESGGYGVGTVHHIAWRAEDDENQLEWRSHIQEAGFRVTEVMDRQYFKAVYFREKGGVLFEIATDPPGFLWDEEEDRLGTGLKLPPWLEPSREKIENIVIPVTNPAHRGDQ
ncbi:ring-cleaving dioxygenase [Alteribacter natronophilus]|uniref:ring-cleaving dioxygenase n=1 Tax=Alteribacter natronophilus TaxID=2583810 RepID=UPI00110D4D19|nr:ring-cleaving dioxygenase [Alteribacter natronophilus]TMW70725.1 ring-cleaving dioxygenase [Alteribacter natronophilus]